MICIADESEILVSALQESEDSLARMPWRNIAVDGFDNFFWRPGESTAYHRLWCNGIRVLEQHRTVWERPERAGSGWSLAEADVMVFDSLGTLPINLARDGLSRATPYSDALRRDILLDHCAWLLCQASLGPTAPIANPPMWSNTYYNRGQGDGAVYGPAYVKTDSGIVPFLSHQISRSPLTRLLVHSELGTSVDITAKVVAAVVKVHPMGGFHPESMTSAAVRMLAEFLHDNLPIATLSIFSNAPGDALDLVDIPRLAGWRRPKSSVEPPSWVIEFIGRIPADKTRVFVATVDLDHSSQTKSDDLSELFDELNLPPVIPYDTGARARLCERALLLLDEKIRQHEGMHAEQEKKRFSGVAEHGQPTQG
jgi:hypothetical protein